MCLVILFSLSPGVAWGFSLPMFITICAYLDRI
nr:MAG TPA: hypothetical protein [Caudoviricetes sp.]